MSIRIANSAHEIYACFSLMQLLRPHIREASFVSLIREQQNSGYRLAYLHESSGILALAGFRVNENLAWGRFLYVDDLITLPEHRSKGYGARLLKWLASQARREGCRQLHLDSGVQRIDAQRFYEREGLSRTGFHYSMEIKP